jgi:hypothetical protein
LEIFSNFDPTIAFKFAKFLTMVSWRETTNAPVSKAPKPNPSFFWVFALIAISLFFLYFAFLKDAFEQGEKGNPRILPEREEKYLRELEKLDNAEQYALLATVPGWYPCYNCLDSAYIFLYPGEVWKYGVTTNGTRRYSRKFYEVSRLGYMTQFQGTLQDCLREEKQKIYFYFVLPENQRRSFKLPRPPGNKKDS